MHDRPLKRKYARIERERRFLLEQFPPQLDPDDFQRLHDRYILGAPMRLRRVETPSGEPLLTKLGQKKIDPENPESTRHRLMTTIYLTPEEGEVFASLPAHSSIKRRYKLAEQDWTFVIDCYEAPDAVRGLLIAEVECDTDEALDAIQCPSWALQEITDEPEWSGAKLSDPTGNIMLPMRHQAI